MSDRMYSVTCKLLLHSSWLDPAYQCQQATFMQSAQRIIDLYQQRSTRPVRAADYNLFGFSV
jgi:hypothetical protein